MAISQGRLRRAARSGHEPIAKSFREASQAGLRTAFLCHSHHDKTLAAGVVALLAEAGWEVYVDWLDPIMPATPDRATAEAIQERIRRADFFLFLATQNSRASRWCPWEIGYADGTKPIDRLLIMPTTDDGGTTHGNEYLQLYRHIDAAASGGLGAFPASGLGVNLRGL